MARRICLSRFGCRNRPFYRAMAAGIASSTHRDLIGYSFPGDDGCNSRTSSPYDQFGFFRYYPPEMAKS
uniref:Uncharacterized protein n=1 Tax=Oryza punctata TaxID=4537 RepID=A0A0E0KJL3_ORYPU